MLRLFKVFVEGVGRVDGLEFLRGIFALQEALLAVQWIGRMKPRNQLGPVAYSIFQYNLGTSRMF